MALINYFRVKDIWLSCSQAWTGNPKFFFLKVAQKNTKNFRRTADLINKHGAVTRDWIAAQLHYRRRPNLRSTVSPRHLCEPKSYSRYTRYMRMKDALVDSELPSGSQSFDDFVVYRFSEDISVLDQISIVNEPEYLDLVIESNVDEFSPYFLSLWLDKYPASFIRHVDDPKIRYASKWLNSFVHSSTIDLLNNKLSAVTV